MQIGSWRVVVLVLLAATSGCGDDGEGSALPPTNTPVPTNTFTPVPTPTPTTFSCEDPAADAIEPLCALDRAPFRCDFLIPAKCLLPYPSSTFLTADPSTVTGFRVDYPLEAMPANIAGVHIDPTEWGTLDGFSPGPIIIAHFPQGVDLLASQVPPITEIARSLDPDSPTVLIDAETGEHIVHFTELDVQASRATKQAFLIRPGVRLQEATRYIVAIRNLVDPQGSPVQPERAFRILRDATESRVQTINDRREQFEDIFDKLEDAGVERTNLILAWDFVTASTESLTGRMLALRDQGLAANGPGAPPFQVTSVEDEVSDRIFRRVRGTFTVPLFMQSRMPPTRYNLDEQGVPRQNGTAEANFIVNMPRIAVEGDVPQPGRPLVYGHGLLGGAGEVNAGWLQTTVNRFNFIVGGTDWIGMADEDVQATMEFLIDLSAFPALPDRLQQAMLNFILLGRLMTAPDGLNSHAAFQIDGVPIIDTRELYYYGNSQGGIQGGTYMAITPDTIRGVLGVPASNYSILLQRSADFSPFQFILNQVYVDELERQLIFPLLQQLWDRGEPQGYLSHLVSNPLPNTPAKKILLQVGVHDSQVPDVGAAVQARSLGIPTTAPSAWPQFGIPEVEPPFDGSAIVPYDVNGIAPPLTNTAPPTDNGVHEAVRRLDAAQRQIDAFLRPDGRVENFCDGPCFFRDVPDVDQRD